MAVCTGRVAAPGRYRREEEGHAVPQGADARLAGDQNAARHGSWRKEVRVLSAPIAAALAPTRSARIGFESLSSLAPRPAGRRPPPPDRDRPVRCDRAASGLIDARGLQARR